jgi:hypothetical protein
MRIIGAWIVMTFLCATAWPQTNDFKRACGSIVHIFPNAENLPDPALGSLPVNLQRNVEKTLRPFLAKEAKITGADADGSKIDDVKDSLRMHRIGRDAKGKELYAAWWNIPTICGHFDSCPIWLLEVDSGSGRVNNLVRANEPDNPAANADGGWGIAVLPSEIPLERLMITSSAFAASGPGPAQAVPLCWRRQGEVYISDPCPPACMEDLNRNSQ